MARYIGAVMLAAIVWVGRVGAQDALLEEVRTLSAGAAPVEHPLDITRNGAYQLTLTDLRLPAALTSAKLAVTRGSTVIGTASITPASDTAVLEFNATEGAHVIRIVGQPASGSSGTVGVKVMRVGESSVYNEFVAPISSPATAIPENRTVFEDTFTAPAAGTYEVTLADLEFPQALPDLLMSVTEVGGPQVAQLLSAGSATFTGQAGVEYKILAIGESPIAVSAGLFSVRVRQAASAPNVYSRTVRVGRVERIGNVVLNAGPHVFGVNDLQFPVALGEVGAALTIDGVVAVATDASGDHAFTAVSGDHSIYVSMKAAAGGPGSYGVEVRPDGGAPLFTTVKTLGGSAGTTPAFNYAVDIQSAGNYRVRLTDFEFPSRFDIAQLGVSQGGALLGQLDAAGTLEVTNVGAGQLFVLVLAEPTTSSGGMLGLDVAPAAGGAPVFETTQGVGNLFQARKVSVPGPGTYRVKLTDLQFPAKFFELGAVVTRGVESLGTVLNSSHVDFEGTAGNYFVNFIATPDGAEKAGTYAIQVAAKPAAPTVTLAANPTQVVPGAMTDLTWTAENATRCEALDGWSGLRALTGTERTPALTAATTTFRLECTGEGGVTSASVTVMTVAQANPSADEDKGGGGAAGWLLLAALALSLCARAGLHTSLPRQRAAA